MNNRLTIAGSTDPLTKSLQLDKGSGNIRPNRVGELGVVLFVSESTKVFDNENAESEVLTLPQIVGAAVGELVHAGVLVDGYTPGEDGLINFVVDMKVLGPDGQVVVEEREWTRYRDEAPQQPSFIMAKHRLDLAIEPGDPVGEYTIVATVRDLVSGNEKSGSYSLLIMDLEYG